jgi:5-methylcytosine-specific restriction endonuclease McrA
MLDHKKAMELWKQLYGKATKARDSRKRLMDKAAYGQQGSEFGWNVHHKIPKNRGGTDALDNLQIVHVITHDEIHGR